MINEESISNWKTEHFLGYLYLTISYADCILLKEEIEMAETKLGNFLSLKYPEAIQLPSPIISELILEIKHHTNNEKYDLIKSLAQKFHFDQDMVTEIISDLADIVSVDDVVDLEEHKALARIRGIFHNELYE